MTSARDSSAEESTAPGNTVSGVRPTPDAEFVDRLRARVQRYLDAMDAWESAYQKYYRLPAPGPVSSDLETEHQEFLAARAELAQCLPRARQLCQRHSLREPWPAMLHVNLGARTPQSGSASAIGRAERGVIAKCLDDLDSACRVSPEPESRELSARDTVTPFVERRGIMRRIVDYFL